MKIVETMKNFLHDQTRHDLSKRVVRFFFVDEISGFLKFLSFNFNKIIKKKKRKERIRYKGKILFFKLMVNIVTQFSRKS